MESGRRRRYLVEIGDPDRDGDAIVRLCTTELPGFTHAHYSKYFERNPAGPPAVAVARAELDGDIVGVAALHPAEVVVDGDRRLAAMAADFAVDRRHRVFGPALALQRTLLEAASRRGWSFTYGLPNRNSAGVLVRAGYSELAPFVRFVRLLSTRAAVASARERSGAGLRELAATMRPSRVRAARRGFSIEIRSSFDDSFEDVWRAAHELASIVPRRTAEILDWKYEQGGASSRFSVATVSRGGPVDAYAVSYVEAGVRRIVDLAWVDRASLRAVVAAELERGRHERLAALDLLHLGGGEDVLRVLDDFGFSGVPTTAVRIFAPVDPSPRFRDPRGWLLFEGAIDL